MAGHPQAERRDLHRGDDVALKRLSRRLWLYLAIFIVVAGASSWLALRDEGGGLIRMLELRAYDARDDLVHGRPRSTGHVVIVEVDEASVAALGRWPFDRKDVARVVETLAKAGAAVVALQLDLRDKTGPASDAALQDAVRGCADRVVLSRGFGVDRQWQALSCDLETVVDAEGLGPPLAMAEVDGSRRRVPVAWRDPPCTPFCVLVAGRWSRARPRADMAGAVLVGSRLVPYSHDGTIVVRTPRYREEGDVVSFLDVWKGIVPAERLRGRIALVTPPHNPMVDPYEPPGFVQAAAIEQVLWGRPVTHAPPAITAVAAIVLVAAMLIVFYRHSWWRSLPAVFVFLAVYAGLTTWLLWHDRIWLDVVLPLLAGLFCIALAGLAEGFHVRGLFAQMFPRELGDRLMQSGDAAQLGRVLEAVREMSTTLQVDALLDRLVACLDETIPHEWHDVFVVHPQNGERVGERRRGPVPAAAAAGTLTVPMVVEQTTVGAIVLGGGQPFSALQRDLVTTLAVQAASLLRNAQLYEEVVEAHRALAESRALLDQSSRLAAVGQLAAGVAHEINNPLGAVFVDLDGAMRNLQTHPDRTRQKLERARGALSRVRSIVEQLLDFSRDHGTAEEVGLDAVARETLDLLSGAMQGVELDLELTAATVRAHRQRLNQVLTNLLLNAVQAVDGAAERRVRVATFVEDEHAVLEVRDSGCGMPPEVEARIFEPFFTTRAVGRGTGLGLWVSQRVAAQENGSLEVETRPGGPTTFRLRLPRAPGLGCQEQ